MNHLRMCRCLFEGALIKEGILIRGWGGGCLSEGGGVHIKERALVRERLWGCSSEGGVHIKERALVRGSVY